MSYLHVVMDGDVFDHERSTDCPCGPLMSLMEIPGPDAWMVSHRMLLAKKNAGE